MTLLTADGLRKTFALPGGRRLLAVDGVDLRLERGETLAVVGESGCGKSTLGRLLLRLIEPDAGRVMLDGADLLGLRAGALRTARRRLQVVFQDPFGSLDPRQRVRTLLARPMRLHGLPADDGRLVALLDRVGLPPDALGKLPHQFSGGQRQRLAIARALSVEPDAIVCDEPVSALDVSVQAQVVELLRALQRESGVALLFISHDLAVVRQLADRIAVMYAGRVVETGPAAAVFDSPAHPYTRALLAAVPLVGRPADPPVGGEPPDMTAPPPGCRFAGRCGFAVPRCQVEDPALRPVAAGHASACLLAETLPPATALGDATLPEPLAARIAAYRHARATCG